MKIEKLELKHLDIHLNKSLEPMEGELFKEFPENTQYLVSNYGRVLSNDKKVRHNYGGFATKKGKIMTQTDNGTGYLSVGLTTNEGKTKTIRVSRVVAITWIPNIDNKPQVNHINGDKKNNRVCNLEWNTCGENVMHAWNTGLAKKQSKYIEIKKMLGFINQYIVHDIMISTPNGIGKCIIDQSCYRIGYPNGKTENLVKAVRFWGKDLKILLRPISDLTRQISHNGKVFTPIEELAKIFDKSFKYMINVHCASNSISCEYEDDDECKIKFVFDIERLSFEAWHGDEYLFPNQYHLLQVLHQWHFNIHNLPPELYIDLNTLKQQS